MNPIVESFWTRLHDGEHPGLPEWFEFLGAFTDDDAALASFRQHEDEYKGRVLMGLESAHCWIAALLADLIEQDARLALTRNLRADLECARGAAYKDLKGFVDRLQSACERLQSENACAIAAASDIGPWLRELSTEKERLSEQHTQILESSRGDKYLQGENILREIERLKAELAMVDSQPDRLEGEIRDLEEAIRQKRCETENLHARRTALEWERDCLDRELAHLRVAVGRTQDVRDVSHDSYLLLVQELKRCAQGLFAQVPADVVAFERELIEARGGLDVLMAERTRLAYEVGVLASQGDALRGVIERLRREEERGSRELDTLLHALLGGVPELESLHLRLERLRIARADALTKKERLESEMPGLERAVKELGDRRIEMLDRLNALAAGNRALVLALNSSRAQVVAEQVDEIEETAEAPSRSHISEELDKLQAAVGEGVAETLAERASAWGGINDSNNMELRRALRSLTIEEGGSKTLRLEDLPLPWRQGEMPCWSDIEGFNDLSTELQERLTSLEAICEIEPHRKAWPALPPLSHGHFLVKGDPERAVDCALVLLMYAACLGWIDDRRIPVKSELVNRLKGTSTGPTDWSLHKRQNLSRAALGNGMAHDSKKSDFVVWILGTARIPATDLEKRLPDRIVIDVGETEPERPAAVPTGGGKKPTRKNPSTKRPGSGEKN